MTERFVPYPKIGTPFNYIAADRAAPVHGVIIEFTRWKDVVKYDYSILDRCDG
jgi:hypothetical protein